MKKTWGLLVCFTLLFSNDGSAVAGKADVEALLKEHKRPVEQSVSVVRLSDGKTLFEKNSKDLMVPASVTKLITTAAVLAKFSPVHSFTTRFYHTGKREGGKIKGDLVVVGDGDPFVVSEKLWQLAADFRHMGIEEFTGDIVIDNSLFDGENRDKSRAFGKKSSNNAYDAPVSAFGVNFNTVALAVAPGSSGKSAHVSFDPYPLANFAVTNNTETVNTRPKRLQMKRVGDNKVVASGEISADDGLRKIYRSIADGATTPGEYVRSFLAGVGITVKGKVKEASLPDGATLLYELPSYNLRRITQGLNTFSNNYIADVLVKRLGAAFPAQGKADAPGSGTYENGIAAIADFLRDDVGIKTDFTIKNGSGLSTDNRLSAGQITQLLTYMAGRMDVFPDFLASLPASGWDGTLRRRFKSAGMDKYQGLVRAKTGTLTAPVSVAGLGGYFQHPDHGMVAFSILENGKKGEKQPAIADLRDQQDHVIAAMHGKL